MNRVDDYIVMHPTPNRCLECDGIEFKSFTPWRIWSPERKRLLDVFPEHEGKVICVKCNTFAPAHITSVSDVVRDFEDNM